MDDETLNQESQDEGAPLPEDALTDEERARVGLPLADPPQDGNFSRQQNAADRAIDHVISKGYSREAAEKLVEEHGAEQILEGNEAYRGARDSREQAKNEIIARDKYCAVCGIELSSNDPNGCAPGKCVASPAPERAFDPERAERERRERPIENGG